MRIVILGSGRLGSRLANVLASEGHAIAIVDHDETKFRSLEEVPNLIRVHGNIFDDQIVRPIFSPPPDLFIVVTGNDNVNLMVAQAMQRQYHIHRVLVRVFDPTLSEMYQQLGLETICPTDFAIAEMCKRVRKQS